jgi:Uma2 family endonuclease
MDIILDSKKRYTYADYLTRLDDKRRELVNGFVRLMSPVPRLSHQRIIMNLVLGLGMKLRDCDCGCQIFATPLDVRLPENGEKEDGLIYTVVQPDICVICDPLKLDERGCLGAPDLIVAIQSLATAKYDLNIKYKIYEDSGVKEYWVVPVGTNTVIKFVLRPDGKYDDGTVYEKGTVQSTVLPYLEIELSDVFW